MLTLPPQWVTTPRPGRRRWLVAGGSVALAAGIGVRPCIGRAQVTGVYPEPGRAVRLILGVYTGGAFDAQARTIAQAVAEQTGARVEVENLAGPAFLATIARVTRAEPDGYTLLYAPSAVLTQNPHTLADLPYDPFHDFTPITLATRGPAVLCANATIPSTNVRELVAWARGNPGKLVFGSFGVGSTSYLYTKAFARTVGIDVGQVLYPGPLEAVRDLLEGRIQACFDSGTAALANARTGRVRLLGVAAPARNRFMPDVPTLAEQGVAGLDMPGFTLVAGPARMEPRLVAMVNEVFVRALSTQSVVDAVASGAFETVPSTPAQAVSEIRIAHDKWGELVRRIGLKKKPAT